MSTNPSIIFYQGRRCTKIPRQPRATDPPSTTNAPPTTTSSADQGKPDETAASGPSTTDGRSTTAAPQPTTSSDSESVPEPSSNSQDQISGEPSDSYSSDDSLYGTSPTGTSITHATFSTETLTSTTSHTSTSLTNPVPSSSEDGSSGPPYATIFGILFGVLGFIALIIIIFFFFRRRHSRRHSTGSEPGGWSVQKLLPSGRGSPDSTTTLRRDYRSGMSYISDASPTSSKLYKPGAALSPSFDTPVAGTQTQSYHNVHDDSQQNPFSDTAEVSDGLQSSIVPFMMRSSAMDLDPDPPSTPSHPTLPAQSYAPYRDRDRDWDGDSMHSGSSLGSTLVLPGRSSAGSNYQGMSLFPKPPTDNRTISSASSLQVAIARGSPVMGVSYDADEPPLSASRRSSGAMPISLI